MGKNWMEIMLKVELLKRLIFLKKNYLFNIKEYMKNPKFVDELDGNKRDRNCLKHCFILAIHDYFDKYQN